MSSRRSRTTEQSVNALRVVGEIVAEELDASDPRLGLILSLPEAWGKPSRPRWEAARHMLEHNVDYAGEPPLRVTALGLLVAIEEGLNDCFSGDPCDKRRAARRVCQLRANGRPPRAHRGSDDAGVPGMTWPTGFRAAMFAREDGYKAYWPLVHAGMGSFEEVAAMTEDELLAIDEIDPARLGVIREVLAERGYQLRRADS